LCCPVDGCFKGICGVCFHNIMSQKKVDKWLVGETLEAYTAANDENCC
jgi:phosphate starvation-inducible protein PhoH